MKHTNWFPLTRQLSKRTARIFFAAILPALACGAAMEAQSASGFRWLNPAADAATWAKIQNAFQNQLQPDGPNKNGDTVFGYKFLERAGVIDQSALVIVSHQTAKTPQKDDEGYRYSSAFNFDLQTGAIAKIEQAKRMWHWKFAKLARFESASAPDVAFTYLSCWECEPSEVLSTLRYDAAAKKWAFREWEADKMIWWTAQDGLVVDADILEGADDTVSFTCLYGVLDLHNKQRDDVASRCQEVTDVAGGKTVTTDVTAVYSLDEGVLKIKPVTSVDGVKEVTAKLCAQKRSSAICKLPPASTYNSPQLTMLSMFPGAPKTRRDMDCFRSLRRDMSVYSLVDKCGRPDNGGGSAVGFFEYRLDDGSKVTIRWTDLQHILDVVQSDKSGKTKTLLASK